MVGVVAAPMRAIVVGVKWWIELVGSDQHCSGWRVGVHQARGG